MVCESFKCFIWGLACFIGFFFDSYSLLIHLCEKENGGVYCVYTERKLDFSFYSVVSFDILKTRKEDEKS